MGEKGALECRWAKRGGRSGGGVWDIYFFQQKYLGGTKEVPRVLDSPV